MVLKKIRPNGILLWKIWAGLAYLEMGQNWDALLMRSRQSSGFDWNENWNRKNRIDIQIAFWSPPNSDFVSTMSSWGYYPGRKFSRLQSSRSPSRCPYPDSNWMETFQHFKYSKFNCSIFFSVYRPWRPDDLDMNQNAEKRSANWDFKNFFLRFYFLKWFKNK